MPTDPTVAILRSTQDELLTLGLGKLTLSAVAERVGMSAFHVKRRAISVDGLVVRCADAAAKQYARAFSNLPGVPREGVDTAIGVFCRGLRKGEMAGRTGVLSLEIYGQALASSPRYAELLSLVNRTCGQPPGAPNARLVVALLNGAVGIEGTLPDTEINLLAQDLSTLLREGLGRMPHLFGGEHFHPAPCIAAAPDARTDILAVAMRHMIDRDPKGFRIEAIAKEMGVSKRVVYNHFRDLLALQCATLEESLAIALQVVKGRRNREVQRWHHLAQIVTTLAYARQARRLILDERLLRELPEEVRGRALEAFQKLRSALAEIVLEMQLASAIRSLRREWTASYLLAAINGAYGLQREDVAPYVRSLFVGVLRA